MALFKRFIEGAGAEINVILNLRFLYLDSEESQECINFIMMFIIIFGFCLEPFFSNNRIKYYVQVLYYVVVQI